MSQIGRPRFGELTTPNFLLSRRQLIQRMYFGVIRAWEVKDGKRWEIRCVLQEHEV